MHSANVNRHPSVAPHMDAALVTSSNDVAARINYKDNGTLFMDADERQSRKREHRIGVCLTGSLHSNNPNKSHSKYTRRQVASCRHAIAKSTVDHDHLLLVIYF